MILAENIWFIDSSFGSDCIAHSNESVINLVKLRSLGDADKLNRRSGDRCCTIFASKIEREIGCEFSETFENMIFNIVELFHNLQSWFDEIRSGAYFKRIEKTCAWRIA
jgi:dTDP-D-glucose 4,6-dehydratase